MSQVKEWISAIRLRTLPLAIASIGLGSFLAAFEGKFRWQVFALSTLTTIFLQILSNLANDYGDSQHGADSEDREGPSRAVQSGKISPVAMKGAIYTLIVLLRFHGILFPVKDTKPRYQSVPASDREPCLLFFQYLPLILPDSQIVKRMQV